MSYNNNAFRAEEKAEAQKGFFETHGMALGGGVLALGMMLVGSQYMQQNNLSADVTDEETVVEATAEPEATTEVVAETEAPTETVSETETATEENAEATIEEVSETATDETSEASTEESTEEVATEETVSTETTTSTVTNPVTENVAPLYADPIEEEAVAVATAEPTASVVPATRINFVPKSPAVPANILSLPEPQENVAESQEEMNLVPVLPQQ